MALTPKEKKLLRLADLADKGSIAIVEYLADLEEKIEAEIPSIKDVVSRMKGDKGDSYILTDQDKQQIANFTSTLVDRDIISKEVLDSIDIEQIAKLASDKIEVPQPKEVDTKTLKKEVVTEVLSQLPEPEKGEDGDDGQDADITEVVDKLTQDLPQFGTQFRDGLELLPDGEKLRLEAIEGLDKALLEVKNTKGKIGGGSTARNLYQLTDVEVSGATNGQVLKYTNGIWGAGNDSDAQDLQSVTDLGSVTTNSIEANSFIKSGGTSSQFLKADGSVDSSNYITDLSSFDTDDLAEGSTNLYSQWATTGSDIYYNGGNVGIGTVSPDSKLHLSSISDTSLIIEADSDNSGENDNASLVLRQDGNLVNGLFALHGVTPQYVGAISNALFIEAKDTADNSQIQFVTGGSTIGGTDGTARMTINSSGNIGIGTTSPDAKVDILGTSTTENVLNVTAPASHTADLVSITAGSGVEVMKMDDLGNVDFDSAENLMATEWRFRNQFGGVGLQSAWVEVWAENQNGFRGCTRTGTPLFNMGYDSNAGASGWGYGTSSKAVMVNGSQSIYVGNSTDRKFYGQHTISSDTASIISSVVTRRYAGTVDLSQWQDENDNILMGVTKDGILYTNGRREAVTDVKTANYTIVSTDENILCDTSGGAFTVTLPSSPTAGDTYTVLLDVAGNNLTVDGNGNDINGSSTAIINTVSGVNFIYNGTQWNLK